MGALYEDVEKFFGDIFAAYGQLVCKVPYMFICAPVLLCGLLGLGLLNIDHETKLDMLYTPRDSQALADREALLRLFPDRSGTHYYVNQSLGPELYTEIIITPRDDTDGHLGEKHKDDIDQLQESVFNITLFHQGKRYLYQDLCARRFNACVVDRTVASIDSHKNCSSEHQTNVSEHFHSACKTAYAIKLRFSLRTDGFMYQVIGKQWEKRSLEELHKFQFPNIDFVFAASHSLELELQSHIREDIKFFPISVIIMMTYATVVSSGGDCVSTKDHLGRSGILSTLLALVAAFGALSFSQFSVVDACGIVPYLVLGIGMDNVFKFMTNFGRTDVKAPVVVRVTQAFRLSAISLTITSLTTLFVVAIGATSPFLVVKNFCVYSGVALAFCYLNQLTFFAGCMVLHARRIKASRHCVTCLPTKSRADLKSEGRTALYVWLCGGQPPRYTSDEHGPWERIPLAVLPKILLSFPSKFCTVLLFGLYIGVSAWGASQTETGLKLQSLLQEDSYLYRYIRQDENYFSYTGHMVSFIVMDTIDYTKAENRGHLRDLHTKVKLSGFSTPDEHATWLESYEEFLQSTNRTSDSLPEPIFLQILQNEFLKLHPEYINDIVFAQDQWTIRASRFSVRVYKYDRTFLDGVMMQTMRALAVNSSLPVISYGPEFIYIEHYVSILKNTLLGVCVAMVGMLFVALMFIPHPIAVTCVIISMVTIVLGVLGIMHFLGLALSAITKLQVILSVGFNMEFTVQTTHAFMTACGKSRNERVGEALKKVGVPILNSALSTLLAVVVLAFGNSYLFSSFFKATLLVILLSVVHALLFLPVILSFIGPRRTRRPKVFIPVSPSSRSLQYGMPSRASLVCRHGDKRHDDEHQPLNPVLDHSAAHSDGTDVCPISPSTKTSFVSETDTETPDDPETPGFPHSNSKQTSKPKCFSFEDEQIGKMDGGNGIV